MFVIQKYFIKIHFSNLGFIPIFLQINVEVSTFVLMHNQESSIHLKKLKLLNFKNYEETELHLSPKINCFSGDNGMGKTNILDAIYYLSLCKSYFSSSEYQNIRHGQTFFVLQGYYQRGEGEENILCSVVKNKKKQFKRNNKEYHRLANHIGLLPIVMISPRDNNLIMEGSEDRRKFINSVISQYDHEYLHHLLRYNKALTQRNKLLKSFAAAQHFDRNTLDIWNDQLIEHGNIIFKKRKRFIQDLRPLFEQYYHSISGGKEQVALSYESQLNTEDFSQLLEHSLEKDQVLTYTTTGIHKDDLTMTIGDFPIKKHGSQGQQKTFLVALKMAQFDFIHKHLNCKPILLLDDIFDKFDQQRVNHILQLVADEHFGQIFITNTDQASIQSILSADQLDYKLFHITNGHITVS